MKNVHSALANRDSMGEFASSCQQQQQQLTEEETVYQLQRVRRIDELNMLSRWRGHAMAKLVEKKNT